MAASSHLAWPRLMDEATAARYLGVSVSTLRRWRSKKEITARQVGGLIRYHIDDLDAYADGTPDEER